MESRINTDYYRNINSSFTQNISPENSKKRTGCFWEDVIKVEGDNDLGGIIMHGLLRDKMSFDHNPKGPIRIQAENRDGDYVFNFYEGNDQQKDIANVYWLPWSSGLDSTFEQLLGSEFVTIEDLNISDCQFFMTSNLSGCRFVATDKYLTHISKAHLSTLYFKGGSDVADDANARDKAEETLITRYKPTKRLALSPSNTNSSFCKSMPYSSHYSYHDVDTAFVIGIKTGETWTRKYLKYLEGEVYCPDNGTWHTMEYGEETKSGTSSGDEK